MKKDILILHCWASCRCGDWYGDGESYSCLLPKGHEGRHKWTRDDKILIRFLEDEEVTDDAGRNSNMAWLL